MNETERWCEHMSWRESYDSKMGWYIHGGGWATKLTSESMFCPICSKSRPKDEIKELAEKLLQEHCKNAYLTQDYWERLAKAGLNWFHEKGTRSL